MPGPYDDILNLPHHVSAVHPQMPMSDRAAQFSPFAALSGYEDAIGETGRWTGEKQELLEETRAVLDWKQQCLMDSLSARPEVSVTYFVPDGKKAGGSYVTADGKLKRIDTHERVMILSDGKKIPLDHIMDIQSGLFGEMF